MYENEFEKKICSVATAVVVEEHLSKCSLTATFWNTLGALLTSENLLTPSLNGEIPETKSEDNISNMNSKQNGLLMESLNSSPDGIHTR
ncbi:hypothetical protein TNCT_340991 [Trichonephila clavata]|uniref:Uncharacterized protein n=1 Tax=Trichonephila clavata TaxID=2740835 RepID=A0A8X6J532_TRICU|nr:hypothetical protein TNCT_340991 [Trichonephila clavata]